MLVCTSVRLMKAAVNLLLNVLLMSSGKHNREKRTSCSALLSFPAGFVFLCETGVFLWRKIQTSFMSSVWKVHVWFTRITSPKHKHSNRVEHGVYVISTVSVPLRLDLYDFDLIPLKTSHVLMSDCLCKYFHSEVAEVNVSSWPSCFLWHSKTFQLRILLLFSAREPRITLMTRRYRDFEIYHCSLYIPYQEYDDILKLCFYLFPDSFCFWWFSYVF